jgi:hypothetical protein
MSYKEILGIIASAIAIVSYIPYLRDITANKTKPHAFSWLIWSLLTGIAFFGQLAGGAGPGAWVNGFTTVVCFIIFIFGLLKGRSNIVFIDWLSLMGAGIAILFWFITKGPLLSVILVTVIDALGFFPTFRKSYHKPHEETLITYVLSSLKYVFSLLALQTFSVVTALFPIYLVLANGAFVVMVLIRLKQLKKLAID